VACNPSVYYWAYNFLDHQVSCYKNYVVL